MTTKRRIPLQVPGGTLPALLALFFFGICCLHAQGVRQLLESLAPSRPAESQTEKHPSAQEQLEWVKQKVAEARQNLETANSEGFSAKVADAGLPTTTRALEIQREAEEALNQWQAAQNLLEWIVAQEAASSVNSPPLTPPATADAAIALENEAAELKNRLTRLQFEASQREEAVARAEQQQREARRTLAQLQLEAEAPLPAQARERSDVEIFQARLRLDSANAQIFFQRWLRYRHDLEIGEITRRSNAVQEALVQSGHHRILSAQRALAQIEGIEKKLPAVEADEAAAVRAFEESSADLAKLRAKVDAASASGEGVPDALRAQLQAMLARFSQQEALRSAARAHTSTLRHSLTLWKRISGLVQNPSLENFREARRDLDSQMPDISAMDSRVTRLLEEKRTNGDRLRQELRMPGLRQAERLAIEQQLRLNEQITDKLLAVQNELASLRNLQRRLVEELDAEISALSAKRRWKEVVHGILVQIEGVWNFSITEQGNRIITLGTVITAIIALLVAVFVSRIFAHRISLAATRRFRLGTSQTHLVEKLTLYVLSVLLIFTVLQWLQIPLTIFAFLGGALAVGIGFGSQTLINNFISGLLLLLERKINVGDLVEVDGNFGRVTNLGNRCSSIQRFDGVEVLVPNSVLLEKNVVNWTLSDPNHRYDFVVGVAYDSDVELVMKTLKEALDAQPELLRDPEPEVAFEDFAESTLNFRVYYWLIVGAHNPRTIGTELRMRIARLFKERGINIAYPQRDLHLYSETPVKIQLERKPRMSADG